MSRLGRSGVRRVGRENFGERDRGRREFRRVKHAEERTGESTAKGRSHVVRMTFDHERIVLNSLLRQLEVAERVTEQDSGNDRRGGRSETSTERDLVVDVDLDDGRGEREVMRQQDVESDPRDQVLVRVQRCLGGPLARVREQDLAVRLGAGDERDVEREVARESETEHIETGADVC